MVNRRLLAAAIARGAFELLLAHVDDVTALVGIVGELVPGQWMVVVADAKEPAKRHDGILGLARSLIDHTVKDRAELIALTVVNGGAFHLVGGDQSIGFGGCYIVVCYVISPF